jgi:subtilisin family serine protease
MATPHTTGVAALYLQLHPAATPAQVRDALFAGTTKGVVTSSRTTNNHLLFTDY